MAAIHRAAFSTREAWSRDVIALQMELPGVFGLIAEQGGMILARVTVDEAEILTLAVSPLARRAGLGRALLRDAMDRAWLMGAAAMFLEVAVTNAPARALYAGQGFSESGLRRGYYPDGTDALVLRAALPGEPGGV